MEQLYEALTTLRGSRAYSNVSYKLTDTPRGYQLHFILEEKYERNLNLGIRFDSEEIASLLLNVGRPARYACSFVGFGDGKVGKTLSRPGRIYIGTDADAQFQFCLSV